MKRVARWLGWTVFTIALLYGFLVLAGVLWLRDHLTPANYAQNLTCWSVYKNLVSGPDKYRQRPAARDALVIYTAMPRSRGHGPVPPIRWRLRGVALEHIYSTYWPEAERRRLFEEVASRMRPCRPAKEQVTRSAS